MNRRGLSRALAVTSILTAVAAVAPATASAATTSPPTRLAATAGGTGASLAQRADWAAEARQAATAGRLTLPSMLLTSGANGLGARRTPGFSAITGVVRGADGAALGGACVTASGAGGTVSVRTGADGRYVLAGLRPGAYTVSYLDCARPAEYFEQWSGPGRVLVRASQPTRLAPETLRLTSPAAATQTLGRRSALAAAKGDTISGIVRSRSGRPLAAICASAWRTTKFGAEGLGAATGPRGRFSLVIGSSGKWRVMFTANCGTKGNYAPQWWRRAATPRKAAYLHARPGHNFRGIDASLRPGASISGVVRSHRSGQPLAHICVDAYGQGQLGDIQEQAITRANGSYLIKNLGTGRYTVEFNAYCDQAGDYLNGRYHRAVAVTDGKTTTGINGDLDEGAAISGMVTSQASGAPVASLCVTAIKGDNEDFAFTGKHGGYSFSRLPAGHYEISFAGGCGNRGSYAPQYYDGQANAQGATLVAATAGQTTTSIDAVMRPGATVTGRVSGPTGTGLAGVCVLLASKNLVGGLGPSLAAQLDPYLGLSAIPVAYTGHTGHYRVTNMQPGQYAVEFITGCGGGRARFGSHVFAPNGHGGTDWVWAGGGTVTAGVSITLHPGGSISGVVRGPHGRRPSGVCAEATDPATQGPLNIPPHVAFTRHGAYRITGLAAGRYAVVFLPCGGQPVTTQWYRRQASRSAATLVPVRTGRTTTGINATLISGGALSGRVVSAQSGKGVPNFCVFVTDRAGSVLAAAATGPSGRYRITQVPAGRWNLEPVPCLTPSPLGSIVYRGVRARNGVTRKVATIRLPEAGGLAGTVTGGTPVTAQPGICVEAAPVAGNGQPGTGVTGPGGRYTLAGLAPGRYRVLFTPDCVLGTAEVVPVQSRVVTVQAGVITAGTDARLAADGGIAGNVSVSGHAAVGVCVTAFARGHAAPAALAITRAGGRYELDGLTPGRYQVEFTAGCGDSRYPAQWFQGARTRSSARTVTVTAGSMTAGITES
jgi:Carboxypeptidase regulatory-like domain